MITTSEEKSITSGLNHITKKYWYRNGQKRNEDYVEALRYIIKKASERVKWHEERLKQLGGEK